MATTIHTSVIFAKLYGAHNFATRVSFGM